MRLIIRVLEVEVEVEMEVEVAVDRIRYWDPMGFLSMGITTWRST